eukprot:CAMPEP_0171102880 /NCGR_PEP_ID=MMETSP0766_2-20121228/58610_1 /TAXON_ID=439317 /ORGANISM="Gambierdiscus australes, Strain CAWD 149" /LENGTH=342 /DNA_ID=CAMNT_0011563253 /DNA_START=1 /DNA_END=1029 /DNA_ORIENTATION=+
MGQLLLGAVLCFLWPLVAEAKAEVCDEATMVQSTAVLTPAQLPGVMPGQIMPGQSLDPASLANPSTFKAMLDLSPLIDMVEVFDQLINAFRNTTVRTKLTEFVQAASTALNLKFNEVDNGITEALVHSSQLGPQAAMVVPQMLLDFRSHLLKVKDIIEELSDPLQTLLPSKFNAAKIMDPEGLMNMLEFAFNSTQAFLEGHANGSLAVDQDYCPTMKSMLKRLGLVGSLMKKVMRGFSGLLEDTTPIDESPMVIIAPDIIPSLREYSIVAIRSTVDMCGHFSLCCRHAIHASIETLRDNAICNIDEAKLLVKVKSGSQSPAAPFGMLALLLLAVLSLTERSL